MMSTPNLSKAQPRPGFVSCSALRATLVATLATAMATASVMTMAATANAQTPAGASDSATASTPTVAVYVVPKKASDAEAATLLQKILRQQLGSLGGVKLHSFTGKQSPPTELLAAIEAGYRALNDAVTTPQKDAKGLGNQALQSFAKAQEQIVALGATGGLLPRRAAARLYKGMAVAHALNEDGPTAQRYIDDSLNLWPQQTPREYGWSTNAANLMSFAAKRRADNTDTGKLAVTGVAGAAVWVDGKERGAVPITVDRLRPGKHHVVVRADGYAPMNQVITVAKDETVTLGAALKPLATREAVEGLLPQVAKQRRAPKATPLLTELGSKLGADGLIVAQVATKKGKWALNTWSVKPGQAPRLSGVVVARDAEMMSKLSKLASDASGGVAGGATKSVETSLGEPPKASLLIAKPVEQPAANASKAAVGADGVEETEFYETWWFWTAVGGGVAIITTAAILAAVLSEDEEARFGQVNIKLNPL